MFRRTVVTLATFAVLAVGCSDEPLTGVEAQAAYLEAADHWQFVPGDAVIVVDGVVMPASSPFLVEDPEDIVRIEVVQGQAAQRLAEDSTVRRAIYIYTSRSTDGVQAGGRK